MGIQGADIELSLIFSMAMNLVVERGPTLSAPCSIIPCTHSNGQGRQAYTVGDTPIWTQMLWIQICLHLNAPLKNLIDYTVLVKMYTFTKN